ncbi:MAG: hypothetical protein HC898_00250 [Phycisphaerales bacterium]|nr:hypothetical protein [Phycisphaerales bacterium]
MIPEAESRGTGTQPAAERSDSGERTTHDASIFVPEPDDTLVQWEGRLLVEPLPDKPKDLAGPRDMQLALAGSPVEITTTDDDHITAGLVEYLLSGDQLRLKGNTQNPVEIRSKELGLLTLPELVLVPREGRGVILGGGNYKAVRTCREPQL